MKQILENANEFMGSGEDNVKKERWNAATADFFKAIVIFCDYLLYKEMRNIPKNHSERFSLLKQYFSEIYTEVSRLFNTYTNSYNNKVEKEDVIKIRNYAYEIKRIAENKK
jgi:hypothetical protein